MLNRVSALFLVFGAIAGYAISGRSVMAQSNRVFFPTSINPGDTVVLTFERGTYAEGTYPLTCAVAIVQDEWIRCGRASKFGSEREEEWYRVRRVVQITKQAR